tara:strand:- start:155 stop:961 length:807 start_codon:yes stop_codon:yes gene_type:complete
MAASPQRLFSSLEAQYKLPQGYLNRLYQVESTSGRKMYNETSGAAGPFQFMPKVAKQYGLDDPYDLEASAEAAARLAADNRRALAQEGIQDPSAGVLYLAHQQGARGAAKLLANADKPATALVGKQAVVQNAGKEDASAGEFASNIVNKFEGRDAALAPYSAVGETAEKPAAEPSPAEVLASSAVLSPPEENPYRETRGNDDFAEKLFLQAAQSLQQPRQQAPRLPIPRLSYAEGGIVDLVTKPLRPRKKAKAKQTYTGGVASLVPRG